MRYEKSCGAVIFTRENGKIRYVLAQHLGGHYDFPKGHMEPGETEQQTALREVFEEVHLQPILLDGFREEIEYSPAKDVYKQVVFYLAEYSGQQIIPQPEELRGASLVSFTEAMALLTYENSKQLLMKAHYKLTGIFLQTQRLVLRNVAEKDAQIMYDYRNNDLCARFQRGQTKDLVGIRDLVQRRCKDTISDRDNFMVAVALKDNDQLVGEIVVMPNDGCFSIGYTFHYLHHRKGYAFEALSALTELLHSCYPDMEFICFTEPENTASRQLLLKLGYKDMGYIPQVESQMYGKWLLEQVQITPLRSEDTKAMVDLFLHPEIKKTYMLPDFPNWEAAEKLFTRMLQMSNDPERFVMGIYAGKNLVGFMNETEKTENSIEIGWVVHPDYQNRGFATQAATAAIELLFRRGYLEVTAGAFEENPASLRVMEKCGMTRLEKTDYIDYRDKTHRCIYYAIQKA